MCFFTADSTVDSQNACSWSASRASHGRTLRTFQGGEDDLDALLAKFVLEDAQKDKVEIKNDVPCPSARVYASYTAVSPDKVNLQSYFSPLLE